MIQGDTSAGREACEAIVKAALEAFGTVDILVNNAGITRDNLLMRMDAEEWDAVLQTNLAGPFWMTRAMARPMMKARSGRIINMTLRRGTDGECRPGQLRRRQGGAHRPHQDHRSRARQPGDHLQRPRPGPDRDRPHQRPRGAATEAIKTLTPMGYVGSAEDVAAAAVYLASDEARYVTGQVIGIDGGMVMGS